MKVISTVISVLALIVSGLSAFYAYTGVQEAKQSNRIAEEAQETAENLFLVEKRPYVDVKIPKLENEKYLVITGKEKLEGEYSLELNNLGGLPASNIQVNIHYLDTDGELYENTTIAMAPLQKILPGKFQQVNMRVSGSVDTSILSKALNSGELLIQVEVSYGDDIEESAKYYTVKQFKVSTDRVVLVRGLGEFH